MTSVATLQRKAQQRREAAKAEWLEGINGSPFTTLANAFERSVQRAAGQMGYEDARGATEVSMRDFDEVVDRVSWMLRCDGYAKTYASWVTLYQMITRAYGDDYMDQYLSENDPEY
jgi:hypothetical protein